jgi:transposase-like protein
LPSQRLAPRVINTDEHAGYPPAIVRLKAEETLEKNCRHRPVQYLNNVLEQDHRAIKRRVCSVVCEVNSIQVQEPDIGPLSSWLRKHTLTTR